MFDVGSVGHKKHCEGVSLGNCNGFYHYFKETYVIHEEKNHYEQ